MNANSIEFQKRLKAHNIAKHAIEWPVSHIYILVDPRNNEIRYVGKTSQLLSSRLFAHMQDKSDCHRVHWLNKLKREGLVPIIEVLETIEGEWPWQEAERYWIARLKAAGCNLTNNTSGGDGVPDLSMEARQKLSLRFRGKKLSPEHIEKMRVANLGRIATEETKAKMRERMRGRKITWTKEIAEANRKLTVEQCDEITARRANGELIKDLAKEYGVHRTTISKIKTGKYFIK